MKILTSSAIKLLYITIATVLLFLGCKKDELTAAQWGERAYAKRSEIQALSANIPCSQKLKVSVQTIQNDCSPQFFMILESDMAKYEKLKKEYLNFLNKQYAAWTREGLIIEICSESLWATDQPIKIDCINDKLQLITSATLPVEEAKLLIDATKTQIDNLISAQTCSSEASWAYTRMINHKTMTIEYITFSRTTDYKALKEKVSLYNRLNFNVIAAEQKGSNLRPEKAVEKIECVSGKPVIKYSN